MDSIDTDNVLPLLYIFLNLSLLTVHKSIYPTTVDFFILLSSLFIFRMHTSTTNPGMPVHVTERLLMTFCHARTKWERSRAKQAAAQFPAWPPAAAGFDCECSCVSGRRVHGAEELRSGRAATLHAGGALQGQSVQHPCALHACHSAVRPGKGEEGRGGAGKPVVFFSPTNCVFLSVGSLVCRPPQIVGEKIPSRSLSM